MVPLFDEEEASTEQKFDQRHKVVTGSSEGKVDMMQMTRVEILNIPTNQFVGGDRGPSH